MDARVNYALVGFFVLLLGAAFVGIVLWLSVGGFYRSYDRYVVYFSESVAGLTANAEVTYMGVNVGRVAQMELDPETPTRVRLLIEVVEETPVKTDTVAKLQMQGLTGLRTVNLAGGSPGAERLKGRAKPPYPVIPGEPSLFGRLEQQVSELLTSLADTTAGLNRLLRADNQAAISGILSDLKALTGSVTGQREAIAGALTSLRGTLGHTEAASSRLPKLMEQLGTAAASLDAMASDLSRTGGVLRRQLTASGGDIRRFTGEALPEATALVAEMKQTAENFRRMSEQLERNPSVLLYGPPRPEPGPGE